MILYVFHHVFHFSVLSSSSITSILLYCSLYMYCNFYSVAGLVVVERVKSKYYLKIKKICTHTNSCIHSLCFLQVTTANVALLISTWPSTPKHNIWVFPVLNYSALSRWLAFLEAFFANIFCAFHSSSQPAL